MNFYRNLTFSVAVASMVLLPIDIHAATQVGADISNTATSVGKAVTDTTITTKVKALLTVEPDIKSFDIGVTTKNGIVYLKGNVDTGLQANKAVQIALGVSGVKDVDDSNLRVKSSNSYIADAFTTAKVMGMIGQLEGDNRISSNNDLHVETTNGAVHIFGAVGNSDDIATIKKSVAGIKGVKSVNIDINVAK